MLGSCFTDNIGERLLSEKFDVICNPMGTLFNPMTILDLVDRANQNIDFTKEEFFQKEDLWHHWQLNNNFSSPDLESQISRANEQLEILRSSLKKANYLFITLGTAWVYRLKETQEFVANCHKVPANNFDKICLSVDEVRKVLKKTLDSIHDQNPSVKVAFTVSPVRHWKDGAEENFKSKSILRTAIEEVITENVIYFPSYEIMMDDLRDYRFYKDDMLHPSDQAVDYIYQFFKNTYCSEETVLLTKEVNAIVSGEHHRPLSEASQGHKAFLERLKKRKSVLFEKHAYLESRW